jgi:hypothetical protein
MRPYGKAGYTPRPAVEYHKNLQVGCRSCGGRNLQPLSAYDSVV